MTSDEEDFIYIGTPIGREEDTSARKIKSASDAGQIRALPAWKQEVRDEDGRRRFHGAFTGGFSAGYYNTAGSKEGWTPQTFTSSRKNRAEVKQQSLLNFLDEDEREEIGQHALETSSKFDTFGFTAADLSRKQAEKDIHKRPSVIPGPVPDELVLPAMNSFGVKLLGKMGWRHGHSINETRNSSLYDSRREARKAFLAFSGNEPKMEVDEFNSTKSESRSSTDEHDVTIDAFQTTPVFVLNPKQDLYGLGYDPFKHAPEFRENKRLRGSSRNVIGPKTTAASRKENLFSSNSGKLAPGFGIGALEELDIEDEDIYESGFEIMETCIDEVEPLSKTEKNVKLLLRDKEHNTLSGFKRATNSEYKLERFPPPNIPLGFKSCHIFPTPLNSSIAYHGSLPPEVPSPDDTSHKILIDGFAALVSRCGKLFEDLSKEKNKGNPLFCFLYGGNGCDYYTRRLWEEQQKRVDQKMLMLDNTKSSPYDTQKMTAESRGRALGEKPLAKSSSSSISNVFSAELQRLQSNLSDNFKMPSSHIDFSEIGKPFEKEPAKQKRFEQFIKDKFQGGLRSTFSGGTSNWSENDRARERLDFEAVLEKIQKGNFNQAASVMQQTLTSPMITETQFVSAGTETIHPKIEEKLSTKVYPKREEFQWRPAPILCKRFDITDPFMGKPPAMPKPRSKMDSFMFTPDFIKGDKLEGNVSTTNTTDLKSNVTGDEPTTFGPVVEVNDKAVHKPVDLYKAIFSDDSDDDGDGILKMQKNVPEKVEGANTTLNRLVAGDFLESLGKELGFDIPTSTPIHLPKSVAGIEREITPGENGKVLSDHVKLGSTSKLLSTTSEETGKQIDRNDARSVKPSGAEDPKWQKNGYSSHKTRNMSSTSHIELPNEYDHRSREHKTEKNKIDETRHKSSRRKRSRKGHRGSNLSDSDSSEDTRFEERHSDIKTVKKWRTDSRTESFSNDDKYHDDSRFKSDKKSSREKHSKHHSHSSSRHRSKKSPDRKER